MAENPAVPPPPPAAVLVEFDLLRLPTSVSRLATEPAGVSVEVVAAVPERDRPATYRLEQLWAIARGWLREPRAYTPDLHLHLVEDYSNLADGFTVLLRDAREQVIGMHGAQLREPGVGTTRYLVVEPARRGQGLGQLLKARQLLTAKGLGWSILQCDLPGDAAAEGVRRLNVEMGGRRVDAFEVTSETAPPDPH